MLKTALEAQVFLHAQARGRVFCEDNMSSDEIREHGENLELQQFLTDCDFTDVIRREIERKLDETNCSETRSLVQQILNEIELKPKVWYAATMAVE